MQPQQQKLDFNAIREARRNPKPARAPKMATQAENLERVFNQ